MRKLFYFIFSAILLAAACGQTNNARTTESTTVDSVSSFVSVTGVNFVLEGKPYYFCGANMWYAAYLGATPEGQLRLKEELDTLSAMGINNLRILGVSEKSELVASIDDAIMTAPGQYNEDLLKGMDFALAEMGKRNMKAVVFLNNYWQWSGGMAQYVSWATGEAVPDPDVTNDWTAFMEFSARFYTTPAAIEINRNYIKQLINRTNTYTGLKYADDSAIMAWELSNEPRPGPDSEFGEKNFPAFVKWVHETAQFIHEQDSNHLVTTGTEGTVGNLKSDEKFIETHDSQYIDYANLHCWAKNWGWFDANNATATLDSTNIKAEAYIRKHIALGRQLQKPLTFEEFGLPRDKEVYEAGTPVTARDSYYTTIYKLIETLAAEENSPLAGSNIWAWGGYGVRTSIDQIEGNANAFMGDPFQEPQGLNSVYITDSTTLEVMKKHVTALQKIANQ